MTEQPPAEPLEGADAEPDLAAFRAKVRTWLADHAGDHESFDPGDVGASRAFRAALGDAGLLGLTLGPEYGGQGLTPDHERVYSEEAARYRLPPIGEAVTTGICAPTLLDLGTEEQKRRHVPRMIRGDEVWTQLLSEPGAGSDLAGLQTKATRDGDEYVITGQKVWTSGAMESDFGLCVARTDPGLPKHQGLSMFIVDLKAPGVTIRPLREMTGGAHFNEVFLDEVRIPASALVGAENDGWRALTGMLVHERLALGAGTAAGRSKGRSGSGWTGADAVELIEMARRGGRTAEGAVRQDLMRVYVAERVLGLLGQKMRDEIAAGITVGAKGSLAKLSTANLVRQSSNLAIALAGPRSLAWEVDDADGGALAQSALIASAASIAGGTSEIQRNTIGERVLGLPKEPQVDRDVPFRDILQNPVRPAGP